MSKEEGTYTRETFGVARVYIEAGWYSLDELRAILAQLESTNAITRELAKSLKCP